MPRIVVSKLARQLLLEGQLSYEQILNVIRQHNPNWTLSGLKRYHRQITCLNQTSNGTVSIDSDIDPNHTFGVEIEMIIPLSVESLIDKLRENHIDAAYESYNHVTRSHWKFVTDGSIRSRSGYSPIELVSPVLKGQSGLDELKAVCKVLNETGCKVNVSCGLHIHHSAKVNGNKNLELCKTSAVLYTFFQDQFNNMLPVSRRHSSYARTYDKVHDFGSLKSISETSGSNFGRYMTVNIESYWKHGTIEFRQHSGSVDFAKISNWIKLTQAVVKRAIQLVLSNTNVFNNYTAQKMEIELGLSTKLTEYVKERTQHFSGAVAA